MTLTRHHLGVAVFAFSTLVHELLLVRWVSARLLNNYAFLIVSLTMAGFAIGGVLLSLAGPRVLSRLGTWAPRFMDAYVVTTLATWVLFGRLDVLGVSSGGLSAGTFALTTAGALTLCLPFVFSGLGIGAYLSAPGLEPTRVYAFDLFGSSLGCVVAIGGLSTLGVELTTSLACGGLVATRLALYPPRGGAIASAAVAGALATAAIVAPTTVLTIEYPRGSMLWNVLNKSGGEIVETRWDPQARVELSTQPSELLAAGLQNAWPAVIGDDETLIGSIDHQLTQNNFAFTLFLDEPGQPSRFRRGVNRTIYGAAYAALRERVPAPSVLSIGVGGAFDVLTALANDARAVTGVEINAATLSILQERTRDIEGHFIHDPRVTLVRADGRHFLARSDERFDVIQLSSVESCSGAQGAAHVFSETYLYTVEAMKVYLQRLSKSGVLSMMRVEHPGDAHQVLRLQTTLYQAMRELGYRQPARHVLAVAQPDQRFVSLLASPAPWTTADVAAVRAWTETTPFVTLTADPHHGGEARGPHEGLLRLTAEGRDHELMASHRYLIWPATDDWPFFFQTSRWSHLIDYLAGESVVVPALPLMLLYLLVTLGGLMLLTVFVPLLFLRREGSAVERPATHAAYFATLGLGFMFAEIYLMQRLALLLGGATYSVTVVLFALLLALTAGSLAAERIRRVFGTAARTALALSIVILLEVALESPLEAAVAWPFFARVLVAGALAFIPGVLMGPWFPLGLRAVKQRFPGYTPWAWGINGAFSVLAPVLAVAMSSTFGQRLMFLTVVPLYLLAGALAARLGVFETPPAPEPDDE
jgi:predicted membrane-bound spermidine synthase